MYSLRDLILFSPEVFYGQIERYNETFWPVAVVVWVLVVALLVALRRSPRTVEWAMPLVLAVSWLLSGVGYHWLTYSTINWAAGPFALVFVAQAAMLASSSRWGRLRLQAEGWRFSAALAVVGVALVYSPVAAALDGRGVSAAQLAGIGPDPTALLTLGMLMVARSRTRFAHAVIPILWGSVGCATAWGLDSADACAFVAFAVAAVGVAWPRSARRETSEAEAPARA